MTPMLKLLHAAVITAARANLTKCSHGGYLSLPACDEPAVWTFQSANSPLCLRHGREHEGHPALWEHRQRDLVVAISAYDAAVEAGGGT